MTPSATLVVLAAGAGSRFGGLKQLAPIGPAGECLLEYSAFDAMRAGFDRLVLVVDPDTERLFRERLDGGMARQVRVSYVHQSLEDLPPGFSRAAGRRRPWGTGHAVLAAAPEVDGPFAVVNADDFYGPDSYVELAAFLRRARPGALAVVGFRVVETLSPVGAVSRALLELDDAGRLRGIVEILEVWQEDGAVLYRDAEGRRRSLAGDELVSMNMWGFPRHLLPDLGDSFARFVAERGHLLDAEFFLPEAVQAMLDEGRYSVEVLPGRGISSGITFRQDQERVGSTIAALVEGGSYPEELWARAGQGR